MSYPTLRYVTGPPTTSRYQVYSISFLRTGECIKSVLNRPCTPRVATRRPVSLPIVASRRSISSRIFAQQGTEKLSPGEWDHVLVAIVDSNPALSTASRSALATAAAFAAGGKLTCLFLDDQGKEVDGSRIQMVQRQLEEKGFTNVNFMEEAIQHSSGQGSVAVGEAADSVGADLVVLSSAAVHEKHVDANLLAEFVPAPVLLLP